MRHWLAGIIALFIACLATTAAAQSVKLKAHEIEALLSGNTAIGKWNGVRYRQFFGADGKTIFAQEGSRSALGDWRVDDENDMYLSIWPSDADWEGWFVMEYAGAFYWVSKSTPPTPFSIVDGQQLVADNDTKDQHCDVILGWMRGDSTNFSNLISATDPAQCRSSLGMTGDQSQHCAWGYPYRAPEAREAMVALGDVISACFENSELELDGALVNHPDSYDLRKFQTPEGTLALSLKDKGGLQQTFVFLRTE